jgi:hypothetical protein
VLVDLKKCLKRRNFDSEKFLGNFVSVLSRIGRQELVDPIQGLIELLLGGGFNPQSY